MSAKRLLVACSVWVGMVVSTVGVANPAWAAAPANDDIGGAVAITSQPFDYTQSTVDATTSAEETTLNGFCGAPTLAHGVWFSDTPAQSGFLVADVTASNYSAGILWLGGTPGNFFPLGCGPGNVAASVNAGETVYLLVFGDGLSPQTSGDLVLNVRAAVPPPTVALTVDKFASVDKFGNASLTGTVTCTSIDGSGSVLALFGTLRQTVGRIFIDGFFDTFVGAPCNGSVSRWQATVFGVNGKFAGGKAASVTIAFGCTDLCSEAFVQTTVQLRRNGK